MQLERLQVRPVLDPSSSIDAVQTSVSRALSSARGPANNGNRLPGDGITEEFQRCFLIDESLTAFALMRGARATAAASKYLHDAVGLYRYIREISAVRVPRLWQSRVRMSPDVSFGINAI